MDEILNALPIIWKLVLGFCGMVAAIGGAAAIIARIFTPVKEIKKRLNELEILHKNDQQSNQTRFDKDLKEIKLLEESNRHICQCMVALMDHEITGNSIERLKNARDELNRFLIEK